MNPIVGNLNQLQTKSAQLVLQRTPTVEYFCTSAPIPGVSAASVLQNSPFVPVKQHGDMLTFQPLVVNFIVDEDLKNWKELFDWMVSYTHPASFDEYKQENVQPKDLVASKRSDGTLLIPNNKYNSNFEVNFQGLFPIDLGEVFFDVQVDDIQVAICTVTFEYTLYTIKQS